MWRTALLLALLVSIYGEAKADACKDVSDRRVAEFLTNSYLTTMTSALVEGAMEGLSTGLSGSLSDIGAQQGYQLSQGNALAEKYLPSIGARARWMAAETLRPQAYLDDKPLNRLPRQPSGFCRQFTAERTAILMAIEAALAETRYPIVVSDRSSGHYETGFVEGKHRAAKWVDRYRVTLETNPTGGTLVIVRRQVFIGRWTAEASTKQPVMYNQGYSNGNNEAWILGHIAERLP